MGAADFDLEVVLDFSVSNLKTAAWVVSVLLGAIALVLGIVVLLGAINVATCHRYGSITGHEVRPAWPAACYVKTDKGWVTSEQIKVQL